MELGRVANSAELQMNVLPLFFSQINVSIDCLIISALHAGSSSSTSKNTPSLLSEGVLDNTSVEVSTLASKTFHPVSAHKGGKTKCDK